MTESTTIKFRPVRRQLRRLKYWLWMKLLQALGVDDEIRRLQARTLLLEAQLDQANETIRDLACPRLPNEFFDDMEILVTQRYDA